MVDWRRPLFAALPSRAIWLGLGAGTAYGLVLRLLAESESYNDVFWIMSIAFVFVMPLALGYLTVRPHPQPSILYRLFAPWIPVLLGSVVTLIAGLEGSICVIMGLPIILVGASVGGLLGGLRLGPRSVETSAMLVLPLVFGLVEASWPTATHTHRVETSTDIQASPARVWAEIVSVPEIARDELPDALYLRMGFPRPLSAEIDRPGIGAIRLARFAGGVLFVETVTEWDPEHRLGFRIEAQTDRIPPTTLDPHVTIGGPYFDVFQGTYRIEPRADGGVRLHLASDLRVTTHFNWYATLWADRIMRSIQRTILEVERTRAERTRVPTARGAGSASSLPHAGRNS